MEWADYSFARAIGIVARASYRLRMPPDRQTRVRPRPRHTAGPIILQAKTGVVSETEPTWVPLGRSPSAAIETLPAGVRPTIQSDHGSGFIAREFAGTLATSGVGHTLYRPHTLTDNVVIERYHRTIGERIEEHERVSFTRATAVIAEVIDHYNHRRPHSSLSLPRPVDYYRWDPEALPAERRRKLIQARERRKQESPKLRQRLVPWTEDSHPYSTKRVVSL